MDLRLPLLADANFHLSVAEEALEEDAFETARRELDKAGSALEELRQEWPDLKDNERGLLSAMAGPLAQRAEEIQSALPKPVAVSLGSREEDPEQELEPDGD